MKLSINTVIRIHAHDHHSTDEDLQPKPEQAIKLCANGLVNEIHKIETAKHFIYRHSNLPR